MVKTNNWSFMQGIETFMGPDSLPLSARQMKSIIKTGTTIASMSNNAVSKSTRGFTGNRGYSGSTSPGDNSGNGYYPQRVYKKKESADKSGSGATNTGSSKKE